MAGGTSLSAQEQVPKAIVLLIPLWGLLFVCIGVFDPALQWLGWRAAQSYVAVPVELRRLELETYQYKGRTQHRPHVDYAYQFAERSYTSGTMFLVDGFRDEKERLALYERLREARDAQQPIMAWVDPEQPESVVLDREQYGGVNYFAVVAGTGWFLFFIGYIFLPRSPQPRPAYRRSR